MQARSLIDTTDWYLLRPCSTEKLANAIFEWVI